MAVRHGYGKIAGTDALVFAYDTGDTKNSFKGRPTTNLFGTTAMEFKSDNPTYTTNIENGTDSIGTYFIKDTVNAPWYTGLRIYNNGVRPLTAGVSYVLSFECRSPQSGWSWSYDSNASGGGWSGNDSGRASNTNLVFDKTGGITYTSDMVNTWQRVTYRVTMKDSSVFTGASAYPHDSFFTNANNVKIYYRNVQLEVGRTNASQYTPGERTDYTGLLDLAGNTSIYLGSTGFDSNSKPYLDGVSELIAIADPGYPSSGTDPFSLEIIYRVPTGATWYNQGSGTALIGRGSYAGSIGIFRGGTEGYVSFWVRLDGGNIYDPAVTGLERDVYHHIVGTFDGVDTAKIYHNGVFIAEEVNANNAGTLDAGQYSVGGGTSFGGNNGGYGEGEIPVAKLYSKALTADEVRNNFRLYKTRFGI